MHDLLSLEKGLFHKNVHGRRISSIPEYSCLPHYLTVHSELSK
uniref:Uncharacterized protein n=1 Tax=Setaria italica TaxID=4555 RepID=A0A0Q3NZF1_SETIT